MYLRFNGEKAQPEAETETELDTYRQQGPSLVVCLMTMMMKMFSEEA